MKTFIIDGTRSYEDWLRLYQQEGEFIVDSYPHIKTREFEQRYHQVFLGPEKKLLTRDITRQIQRELKLTRILR